MGHEWIGLSIPATFGASWGLLDCEAFEVVATLGAVVVFDAVFASRPSDELVDGFHYQEEEDGVCE